jgi:hypothetical protein
VTFLWLKKKRNRKKLFLPSSTAPDAVQTKFTGLKACLNSGQFGTATTADTVAQSSWKTETWLKNFKQTGKQKTKPPKNPKRLSCIEAETSQKYVENGLIWQFFLFSAANKLFRSFLACFSFANCFLQDRKTKLNHNVFIFGKKATKSAP